MSRSRTHSRVDSETHLSERMHYKVVYIREGGLRKASVMATCCCSARTLIALTRGIRAGGEESVD